MTCSQIISRGKRKGQVCGLKSCKHPKIKIEANVCLWKFTKGKRKNEMCKVVNCKRHNKKGDTVNGTKNIITEEKIDYYIDEEPLEFPLLENINIEPSINKNVINTIKDIIKLRGYTIISQTPNEIRTEECVFIFSNTIKVNVNYIKNVMKYASENNFKHIFLVYKDNITSIVKKIIDFSSDIKFELFNERNLYYNILNHSLVPKHELVSDKETIRKLKSDLNNIPIILSTDPVVKIHCFKIGSIIKITRQDGNVIFRIIK